MDEKEYQEIVGQQEEPKEEPKEESKTFNPFDKAMMLSIQQTWLPQAKTISNKVLATNADPRMISNTKKLFDSPELKKIWNARAGISNYLKSKATPFPAKASHFLLAYDLFHEVETKLMEHIQNEEILVDAFVSVFDTTVQNSEKLLGDQFKATDYPSKDTVKSYFTFEWNWEKFGMNERLEGLSKEAAARQEGRIRRQINDAGIACEQLLAEQFLGLLNGFAEKLEPTGEVNKDGSEKRRVIRSETLAKITDFIATLPFRNLTANPELEACGTEVRDLLADRTTEELKENDVLRENLRTDFSRIKLALEGVKNQYGTHSQEVWNKITEESNVFRVMDKLDQGQGV